MTAGNRAGTFATTPLGVILHGTRSGQPYTTDQEYDATIRFVAGGAGGLGWNATIGNNKIDKHINPGAWGWNAREHSSQYIAVELAQARRGDPITDSQVQTFARYFVETLRPWWPSLPVNFPEHYELPAGIRDGKSDCDPDHPGLLARRMKAAIAALEAPTLVRIPAEYVTKFGLPDDHSQEAIQGLIDNFEGVVTMSRQLGKDEGLATARAALEKLEKVRAIVK